MTEDEELVRRIRAGATDDYAELVRRHQSRVFAILHRYERDWQRVEDLAQETFFKAWRALAQFDGRAPFEHWVSRIAVRTALDHLRKETKHRKHDVALDDLGEDVLDWLHNDADRNELEAHSASEVLHLALRQLPPLDRAVIIQQELEGRNFREIAATLGTSVIAVRVRAVRARAKLRRALENLGAGPKPASRRRGTDPRPEI